jgi:hypothetical protein
MAEERPIKTSNSSDEFLWGYYGGISSNEYLYGPCGKIYCMMTSYEMCRNYGVDWAWIQLWRPLDDAAQASINELKSQVRIFGEVSWFKGFEDVEWCKDKKYPEHLLYDPKYGKLGPDWIDLAEDSQALEIAKKRIDYQLDPVIAACGQDALHGVVLAEEQPTMRMAVDPKRDLLWLANNKAMASQKIIFVANALYDHVKRKYPKLKVSQGFYPGILIDEKKELRYDAVVMDCYPEKGNVENEVNQWLKCYPPGPDIYVLLLGEGESKKNLPREGQKQFFNEVFNAFYKAGYRNLGWFAQENRSPLFDFRMEFGESRSPGTFLPVPTHLAKMLEIEKQKRAQQDRVFLDLFAYLPPDIVKKSLEGRTILAQAEIAFKAGREEEALNLLKESQRRYHEAIEQAMNLVEPLMMKLQFSGTLDKIAEMFALELPPTPALDKAAVPLRRAGAVFNTLPFFFTNVYGVLNQIRERRDILAAKIEKQLADTLGNKELPDDYKKQTQEKTMAFINTLYSQISREELMKSAEEVSLLGFNPLLSLAIYSPYAARANCPVAISVSDDMQKWDTVMKEKLVFTEPGQDVMTFRIPLRTSIPRYVRIDFAVNGWCGDIGVRKTALSYRGKDVPVSVKATEGNFEVTPANHEVILDIGNGKTKSIKMAEETTVIRCWKSLPNGHFPNMIIETKGR